MENTQPTVHHLNDGAYQNVFSYWKGGVLGGLLVIASGVLGYYLNLMVYAASKMTSTDWILSGVLFGAVCVLATLEIIFVSYRPMGYGTLVVAGCVMSVLSIVHFSQSMLAGVIVTILFFAGAYARGQRELESMLKIRFFSVVRTVVPLIIMGIAVLTGSALYGAIVNRPLADAASLLMPRSLFQALVTKSSGMLAPMLGSSIDFSLSLRQITAQAVDGAIVQSGIPPASVTPAMKEQLAQKYLPEFESKFETIVGGPINIDEPVSQALYDGLVVRLNALEGNTKIMTLVAIIILLVLTVLAFIPFIHIVVGAVGFALYQILLAAGFGVIVYETQSKEVVVLP
ncbi:MAG: hypothetical protein WC246_01040 [Candidatus Paceibacterota bacterium]